MSIYIVHIFVYNDFNKSNRTPKQKQQKNNDNLIRKAEVRTMKKFIVTREAIIYNVVEAETEQEAIEIAFEDPVELWDIEGADDDAQVEKYNY